VPRNDEELCLRKFAPAHCNNLNAAEYGKNEIHENKIGLAAENGLKSAAAVAGLTRDLKTKADARSPASGGAKSAPRTESSAASTGKGLH
jgi:hypothetical protein